MLLVRYMLVESAHKIVSFKECLKTRSRLRLPITCSLQTHGSTRNRGPYVGQTMLHFQVSLTREIGVIRFWYAHYQLFVRSSSEVRYNYLLVWTKTNQNTLLQRKFHLHRERKKGTQSMWKEANCAQEKTGRIDWLKFWLDWQHFLSVIPFCRHSVAYHWAWAKTKLEDWVET
jgi:hypothetical protein